MWLNLSQRQRNPRHSRWPLEGVSAEAKASCVPLNYLLSVLSFLQRPVVRPRHFLRFCSLSWELSEFSSHVWCSHMSSGCGCTSSSCWVLGGLWAEQLQPWKRCFNHFSYSFFLSNISVSESLLDSLSLLDRSCKTVKFSVAHLPV